MSGSGKRKPLIRAKQLVWVKGNSIGDVQFSNPATGVTLIIEYGLLKVLVKGCFIVHERQFGRKGKTERAKAYAQKWWNRFVRSLRSGLEVKVD